MWSGKPNGRLVAEAGDLDPGTALDVGCGEGADAIWLARRGWAVTAVDISDVAVGRAREAAASTGVTVEWICGDALQTAFPAGSFDLATTAKLLKLRGQAMQRAVPVGEGAMAALLGADVELAQRIAAAAAEGEVCEVANDNDPSQVVLSGHKGAIDRAIALAKDMGAKRAVALPVSAPFHCSLMQPAADAMAEALGATMIVAPRVPLYANVTAAPVADPDTIRDQLVTQVTGMVRWRESVANMAAAGVTDFVELGGKVLGPMVKRIAPDAKVISVVTIEDIEALAKEIH